MIRLSDEQWERVRKHFPEEHIPDGRPGRKPIPTRRVLEAVLWILNTGAQWHMLPQSYPNYKTVHRRFQTWCRDEVLRRVLTDVDNELRDKGVLDVWTATQCLAPQIPLRRSRAQWPAADWQKAFALNFYGALYGIRAVLPIMRKQGSGHIVDIISGIAFMPMAYQTMYAATKAALNGLTLALRYELWDENIRVTSATPGTTAFRERPVGCFACSHRRVADGLGKGDELLSAKLHNATKLAEKVQSPRWIYNNAGRCSLTTFGPTLRSLKTTKDSRLLGAKLVELPRKDAWFQ